MWHKINFFSVRTKITVLFVLLSVFLSVLISFVTYFYVNIALIEGNVSNIQKIATEQVHHTAVVVKSQQLFAKMIATNLSVRDYLYKPDAQKGKDLLDFFFSYTKEDGNILAIYILDIDGTGVISTDDRFVGQNYSFRDYYKFARKGEPYIDNAIGNTSNQFGYYFSQPVRNANGDVLGVAVVKFSNQAIDNTILNSDLAKTSSVMLTDKFGVVLASNRPNRFLNSMGVISAESQALIVETNKFLGKETVSLHYDAVQQMIESQQESTVVDYYDPIDAENENISVIKFDNLPFYLVSEIGMKNIEDAVSSIVVKIIIIFLIGIVLISFLAYRAIIIFIDPLQKFKLLSESIKNGDYSKRIDLNTKDEFGDLANTMNSMADSLSNTFTALERKIAERTRALEQSLAEKGQMLEHEVLQKTEEFKKEMDEKDKSIESKVEERTENLKKIVSETDQMNRLMIGRELKMTELKKEIAELKARLGERVETENKADDLSV